MISKPKLNIKPLAAGIACAFGLIYGIAGYTTLDAGEVGVVVQQFDSIFGDGKRGMQEQTYTAGTFWIDPIWYDLFDYDARSHQEAISEIKSGTKDGQPVLLDVSFEISLTHSLVPTIHETVGKDYYDEIVLPAARKAIRTAAGSVVSDRIYTDSGREEVGSRIDSILQDKFTHRGINIVTNVRDITFINEDFIKILERKAGAGQLEEIERRGAAAAEQTAVKMENLAEGEKQKRIKAAEAKAAEVTLAAAAEAERMEAIGNGSKKQKIAEAEGLLAMMEAEAEGRRQLADALGGEGGARIVEIEWAQNMGPNVKVYGIPTGAPGTNSIMDLNGMLKGAFPGNPK